MIYTAMTKSALKLMYKQHEGQVDRAGIPYVFHPFHLAERMDDEISTTVALLHDVVEDTDMTFDRLKEYGYPSVVIDALKCLTHDPKVDYFDYVKNIGTNPIATKVKIADLEHNSDLSRLKKVTDKDLQRVEKYSICIQYLKSLNFAFNESVSRSEIDAMFQEKKMDDNRFCIK